jgi:hypothetical protein
MRRASSFERGCTKIRRRRLHFRRSIRIVRGTDDCIERWTSMLAGSPRIDVCQSLVRLAVSIAARLSQ